VSQMVGGIIRPISLRVARICGSAGVVTVLALLAIAGCVKAQSSSPNHAHVTLIAEERAFVPSRPLWVGFLFQLDKGWHVYWQNPGDSGEPPRIEWKLSIGLRAGAIQWPRPVRLGTGAIIDYGYEDRVLLMAPVDVSSGPGPVTNATIAAEVKYIVCREICIPGKASLSLAIPLSGDQAAHLKEWQTIFEQTRSQLPKPAPANWKIAAVADKRRFILSVKGRRERHVMFFPLDASVIENSAPQDVVPTDDGFTITLRASDELLKDTPFLRGLLAFEDGRTFRIAAPVGARLR
jgi:DsbC/DsbD-like thiol-disulfide interchange protein